MTYERQIEILTGLPIDGSSEPSQSEVSQLLTNGIRDVINRIKMVNPVVLELFTTVTSDSGSGIIIDGEILDVFGSDGTNDHPATLVSASVGKRSADSSSLSYRSKYNPCYYREGKKVVVKPNGGSIIHVSYPTTTYNAETIFSFPHQYEHLVVLYASCQAMLVHLSTMEDSLPSDLTLPAIPIAPTIATTSETLPTWSGPDSIVLPTLTLDTSLGAGTLTISTTVPVAPNLSDSSITFSESTTYNAPVISLTDFPILTWSYPSIPVDPVLSDTTVEALGNNPTYNSPVTSPDFALMSTQILNDDPEMVDKEKDKINVQLDKYQSDITNAQNKYTQENAIYEGELQRKVRNGELESQGDVQKINKYQAEVTAYSAEVTKQIQGNQGEIASWQQENSTKVQKYTAEVQNALNNFNMENAEYQAVLQKDITSAQLVDANEAKKIQIYGSEVQSYSSEVSKIVQGNQAEINEWQIESATLIQEYGTKLQNSVNEFNKTQVEYQGSLQKAIQLAQLVSNDDAQSLQSYASEVQAYTSDVGKQVQEFTLNEVNIGLAEWSANNTNALNGYASKIQGEGTKHTGDLQTEINRHAAEISKYTSEVTKVFQDNQSNLSSYSAESQVYGSEVQSELGNFNAKIQKLNTKYQWAQGRYTALKQEYNDSMSLLTQPKQQEGGQ